MRPRNTGNERTLGLLIVALAVLALASYGCSGGETRGDETPAGGESQAESGDPEAEFGPLEVGADYATAFRKLNTEPFKSPTHGKRWVNTWVNDAAYQAFVDGAEEFPVGSIVVKESFESDDSGEMTEVRGPIFVMEKRDEGYAPDEGDWWYALHWAEVPPSWQDRVGGEQVYWRGKSPKVDYCAGCHDNLDYADHIGGVPEDVRAW